MNPGGSVKDRAALWIIQEAERNGDLIRGEPGIIVEGTAGNTGIGLALASAVFGYECVIVIARTQTSEKKDCLRQAGAKLIEVDAVPFRDDNHYTKVWQQHTAYSHLHSCIQSDCRAISSQFETHQR